MARFRDKVRLAFRRETSPAPRTASTPSSTRQPNQATSEPPALKKPTTPPDTAIPPSLLRTRVDPGRRIYDAAVKALEEEDQVTIRTIVVSEDVDGIRDAQEAVLAQQRKCENERWTISVKGHTLGLAAVAGALSQSLDKMRPSINLVSQVARAVQPVIDFAASVDPFHIGLPVALIKSILGLVVMFRDQMERLLSGIQTATYMVTQLSLYFEFFKQVNSPAAAENLEDVLTTSYSLVFAFLALGHRALAKRGPERAWELLWSQDKLDEFSEACTVAGMRLEQAANHCSRYQSRKELSKIKEQIDGTLHEMQKLDVIAATIRALNVKIDLRRLRPSNGAAYDFVDRNKEGTIYDYCLPGTRQRLLEEITSWCHRPSQTVFWICGMAGTGKSTLIRTVARRIEAEGLLAASYFFRQDIADQKDGALFVPSIVAQLLTKYPILRPYVAAALDADLTLPGGTMSNQFAKLLKEPMLQAGLHKLVLIVDALDECFPRDATIILAQLAQLAEQVDLRIVITSRPEPGLRTAFDDIIPDSIRLEEVGDEVEADIRLFLQTCFAGLVREDARKSAPRLTGWPGDAMMEQLVQLTKPLFIFAATVFRYVSAYKPRERLSAILEDSRSTSLTGIDRVYLPILRRVYNETDKEKLADFKTVVGSIVLAQDPLSIQALSKLLNMQHGDIEEVLEPLHSVLNIPNDPSIPVRILHKSFRDCLLDNEHEFRIDVASTNLILQTGSLALLENLKQDICSVSAPDFKRRDFDGVDDHIARELEYACLHWISHVQGPVQDNDRVHTFLQRHFLHWLEVLSWLGRFSIAVDCMTKLGSLVKDDEGLDISAFLDDGLRFILMNRHIVDLAPLQLYHSVLVFAPAKSIVRKTFQHEASANFSLLPNMLSTWSPEMLRLQGHNARVTTIALSPDEKLLASSSLDRTVRVWDMETGEERHVQELGDKIRYIDAVAFSLHGNLLVSACAYEKVWVWNAAVGLEQWEQVHEFHGHEHGMNDATAFSPDDKLLVVASSSMKVKMWGLTTGKEMYHLEVHDGGVAAVAFSPNSKLLALALDDKTVRVWDAVTGKEVQKLCGHLGGVLAVAFSPDGNLLTSGSTDERVKLWSMASGQEIQSFLGHDEPVSAVVFSPDGNLLASGSANGTIRVWDTVTGEEVQELRGHDDEVIALTFSHDSRLLISASDDETVRVWDATASKEALKLGGHNRRIEELTFSHDGRLLASRSHDGTVRIWDAALGEEIRKLGEESEKLERPSTYFVTMAFSHDDKLLAVASDATIRVYYTVTGEETQKFEGHTSWIGPVTFSENDRVLVSISEDDTARAWDVLSYEQTSELGKHDDKIKSVTTKERNRIVFETGLHYVTRFKLSPDGEVVFLASSKGTLQEWNTATGEVKQRQLEGYDLFRNAVAFSRDGTLIASKAPDSYVEGHGVMETILVWDTATGTERQRFTIIHPCHDDGYGGYDYDSKDSAIDLALSPDNTLLASSSTGGPVRIWDMLTGAEGQSLKIEGLLDQVEFTAGGGSLRTNVGEFGVGLKLGDSSESASLAVTAASIELAGEWVRCAGQDVLWLPHEYRAVCSAAYGNTLALGHRSGGVSFFRV